MHLQISARAPATFAKKQRCRYAPGFRLGRRIGGGDKEKGRHRSSRLSETTTKDTKSTKGSSWRKLVATCLRAEAHDPHELASCVSEFL